MDMKDEKNAAKYNKILVIDDTHLDRYVAERMLMKNAVADEVICQESAKNALKYLYNCTEKSLPLPEVILLDLSMPEMDGFGFLEAFNDLPEEVKRYCIIMMLSTSLEPNDYKRAFQSPFVRKFLNKPLSKESVFNI